ncbi:MAG: hypothetical protein CMO20_01665 [Thermoplasmata archaeon]|nr:hypothetical protein [Thermoplasmata archaeon]
MVLSTSLAVMDVAASNSKQYPAARNPRDLATGDFDCDGDEDIVTASDMGNFLAILWNDGGTYEERMDIWVSNNNSRRAGFLDIADAASVEVGDIDDDGNDDIVFYQGNIQAFGSTQVISGNLTVLTNDDCTGAFTEDAVYTMGDIVWEFQIGDVNADGVDDIVVLELQDMASGTQRLLTYLGGSQRNNAATNHKITTLDNLANKVYADLRLGNFGETVAGGPITQDCDDLDAFVHFWPGFNQATGFSDGDWDNVSIIEFDCTLDTFSAWNDPNKAHTIKLNTPTGSPAFDIADEDGDGKIDTMAITNQTTVIIQSCASAPCPSQSNWQQISTPPTIGSFVPATVALEDVNQDGDVDLVVPTMYSATINYNANGEEIVSYSMDNLNDLNTVQIILSDGSGGYLSPQSMPVGRRPTMVLVGQFAGGPSSALDLAVGNTDYSFQYSNGALHLDTKGCAFDPINPQMYGFGFGNLDAISVVQLDNEDIGISSMTLSPASRNPDTGSMMIGEGTREVNVTVQNTGLDSISGSVDVDVSVKEITGGTDTVVYSNDFDSTPVINCGTATIACDWTSHDYDGEQLFWHEEVAANHSSTPNGEDADVNPTDYMWAGTMYPNASSGNQLESGYLSNQDEAVILRGVDLTGADAASLEVDLFCTLGYSAVHYVNAQGGISGMEIYDDSCNIDVYTDDRGWVPIMYKGGYDSVRWNEYYYNGGSVEYTSQIYHYSGINYSWEEYQGNDSIDLTSWAGDIIDLRFRFRTGYQGSVGLDNESRNTQFDGMAFDNLTITKTVTSYGATQPVSQTLTLTNFAPGDTESIPLNAYFTNDTEYMIEATLTSPSGFANEDSSNDENRWKMNVLNLYDPAIREITSFEPGALYPSGDMPIDVVVENAGNTIMDFDVQATVFTAQPNALFKNPCKNFEDFEPSACAYMFGDDSNGLGGIVDDSDPSVSNAIVPGNMPQFGSNAYWFGHPDTGYGDDWNESMQIEVDLTQMTGDFAYLTFDYFADADYLSDSEGNVLGAYDYAGLEIQWRKGAQTFSGVVYGSWNDYNENGIQGNQSCEDIDDDGIYDEIELMGDHNDNIWFDSQDLVRSVTLDLTHIAIQNRTGASNTWRTECTSMEGAHVDLIYRFQSNGQTGGAAGFAGFAIDNITVQEYTFTSDQVYTTSVTNIDAREDRNVTISSHNFQQGIYRIDVMSIFDNTTAGNNWTNVEEVALGNNLSRVIFEVASVDVTIYRPNVLSCVEDATYDCVYPIDQALNHQFEVPLSNGVLEGNYNIYLDIVDSSGNVVSSTTSTNSPILLESHEDADASFQPFNGWQDGESYELRFYAQLVDGTPSGNQQNFSITFADTVDVAILSNPTDQSRLEGVKQDLQAMGMTYTQFKIEDWDTYLDHSECTNAATKNCWISHYDKILIPWQTTANVQTNKHYEKLNEGQRTTILTEYMQAGGTIEMHLGPFADGLDDQLLFNMVILDRNVAGNQIEHNDVNIADPYHPLLNNVSSTAWFGMNNGNYVANAALSTSNSGALQMPSMCNGLINSNSGTFHSILNHKSDPGLHLLTTCVIGSGGLLVTTMDVENPSVSEAFGGTAAPIRSNLLSFHVTPYPASGFGTAGNGWDLTINGAVPGQVDNYGDYTEPYYMKSNTELTFSFNSTIPGLDADWEIRGITNWSQSMFQPNVEFEHREQDTHSATFCKTTPTGCQQDVQWNVTLFLHDSAGHTRITHITLITNDIIADAYDPVANVTVEEHALYEDSLEEHGTKNSSGTAWPLYLVKLGPSGDVKVKFDACDSYDDDAMNGESGIEKYVWRVVQDEPYNNPSNNYDGHTFERDAQMGCDWTYTFKNQTANPSGYEGVPIRVELFVEDRAGSDSDTIYVYFVVVPEDWGDDSPVLDIVTPISGSTQTGDYVWINGTVVSGSEDGDVAIEASLDSSVLDGSMDQKVQLKIDTKYDQVKDLGDDSEFSLKLKLSDLYDENGSSQTIYLKIVEGNGQTWTLYQQIDINLPPVESNTDPCVENPNAEGCGEETTDTQSDGGISSAILYGGIGLAVLLLVFVLSLLVIRARGGSEDITGFADVADMDPMEAYVQQLIAQGYPEETARQYAQQYAGHFQQNQ